MKHDDNTRHTYLALLAADGTLTVLENEVPENLSDYANVDEFSAGPKPPRGEEASFRVRFDPNPEPCYTALRAGVRSDSLSLVVAAMDSVKIYRTRPVTTTSYGLEGTGRAFYMAAEIKGHGGLVREVAWAPGNFRGYDIIATACQDGYVRVVRLDTPHPRDGKSWAARDIVAKSSDAAGSSSSARRKHDGRQAAGGLIAAAAAAHSGPSNGGTGASTPGGVHAPGLSASASVASSLSSAAHDARADGGAGDDGSSAANKSGADTHGNSSVPSSAATSFSGLPPVPDAGGDSGVAGADRHWTGEAGQVLHTVRELSKLENHRTPVWRVAFDDDGQILGSVGDDGKLLCYRQTPDGAWARSSELTVMKMRMVVP